VTGLVLLPGMLGGADLWHEVIGASPGRAVQVPGLAGVDSVAGLAAAVLAGAPPRFALAGHSLGGIVALEVVRRAPHRVERLALLHSSARPPVPAQRAAWQEWARRTRAGEFDAVVAELARLTLPASRRSDADLVARAERMGRAVGAEGFLRQLAAQDGRPDGRPGLSRYARSPHAGPVLVVSGALDEVCPPGLQAELAAGLPGARLHRLPDAGHLSPIETPQPVAALLASWLTAPPGSDR